MNEMMIIVLILLSSTLLAQHPDREDLERVHIIHRATSAIQPDSPAEIKLSTRISSTGKIEVMLKPTVVDGRASETKTEWSQPQKIRRRCDEPDDY